MPVFPGNFCGLAEDRALDGIGSLVLDVCQLRAVVIGCYILLADSGRFLYLRLTIFQGLGGLGRQLSLSLLSVVSLKP